MLPVFYLYLRVLNFLIKRFLCAQDRRPLAANRRSARDSNSSARGRRTHSCPRAAGPSSAVWSATWAAGFNGPRMDSPWVIFPFQQFPLLPFPSPSNYHICHAVSRPVGWVDGLGAGWAHGWFQGIMGIEHSIWEKLNGVGRSFYYTVHGTVPVSFRTNSTGNKNEVVLFNAFKCILCCTVCRYRVPVPFCMSLVKALSSGTQYRILVNLFP